MCLTQFVNQWAKLPEEERMDFLKRAEEHWQKNQGKKCPECDHSLALHSEVEYSDCYVYECCENGCPCAIDGFDFHLAEKGIRRMG